MDRNGPGVAKTVPASGHYLKQELYDRVQRDPEIFEFLQAGSLDGIWYLDLEKPGEGWMSPRYKEVLGYRDEEVPNTAAWWRENVYPEDLAATLESFYRHCSDPSVGFDQVVRHRHKDGSTVWVRCRGMAIRNAAGKAIRALGAHTDITAIKRNEERLKALLEASPDMYFEGDLGSGLLSHCNPAFRDTLGYGEIAGKSFLELCDEGSIATARQVLGLLSLRTPVRDAELKLRRQDGSPVEVLLSADGADEDGARTFRAWCRNIDHLRRVGNVEVLLGALPAAVVLFNQGGLISCANPAADQLFGYEKGELTGRPRQVLFAKAWDGGPASNLRGVRRDGSLFSVHCELSSLPLGEGTFQMATFTDMTAREKTEEALRESEYRFRQLIECLPQLVWTCSPDGKCDYLSPQAVAYTGVEGAKTPGGGWTEQIHPDDRPGVLTAWRQVVEDPRPFKWEYRLRRYDGVYRWFEARAVPLRNSENKVMKWFGSSTDIHESRESRLALEREKTHLNNLVTQTPAVFFSFVLGTDGQFHFPYASREIEDLCGVSPEDLSPDGSRILAMMPPEDEARLRSTILESAGLMKPWGLQFRLRHPKKGERWLEGHATPSPQDKDMTVWHGFLHDITERKQGEADQQFLIELGAKLAEVVHPEEVAEVGTRMTAEYLDLGRCSFMTIDLAKQEARLLRQETRLGMSPAPERYSLNDLVTETTVDLLSTGKTVVVASTENDPITVDFYGSFFQPRKIEALVGIPLRRGGVWMALLNMISPKRRNWTEREVDLARSVAERMWPTYEAVRALAAERRAHQELIASEQRLQLALQSASIGIWEQDGATEENKWDDRSRAIFGFPPELRIDRNVVMSCVHPDDRESVQREIDAYVNPTGRGHFEADYRILKWNGSGIRHVYAQGQMFFEGSGETRRYARAVGTVQDVTALKEGEQALRRINLELEQFAYAAAHDLQEPLRNVGLVTQILASRYKGKFDAEADSLLKVAVEGPMRMQAMVRDLLAYSRSLTHEDGTNVMADANRVLADSLNNLAVAIKEKEARITVEDLPWMRMADSHLLQLFQNLIGNALKYCGDKSPIIHVSAERSAGECVVSVKDNGVGIPPEYRAKAFGVFKRLHGGSVPGTGIGLALCKRIVEHYGGKIWIESNEWHGTTIRFTAPRAAQ